MGFLFPVDDLGQILLQEFARWETLSEEPREAWYLGGTGDLRDFGTSLENSKFSMFSGTSMDSKLPSVCSFVDKYYRWMGAWQLSQQSFNHSFC